VEVGSFTARHEDWMREKAPKWPTFIAPSNASGLGTQRPLE
jgi:hypothetical protein